MNNFANMSVDFDEMAYKLEALNAERGLGISKYSVNNIKFSLYGGNYKIKGEIIAFNDNKEVLFLGDFRYVPETGEFRLRYEDHELSYAA